MAEVLRWSVAVGCWGLLVMAWTVGAVHAARRAPRKQARSRPGGMLPLAVVPLTWAVGMLFPFERWPVLPGALATAAAGMLPLCMAFTLWSRATLGAMWTPRPAIRTGHLLRTSGPYAVTRHPIYTGVLAMILCTALLSRQSWALALFAVAVLTLTVKIRAEEQLLREVFGPEYDTYRARVPRLLPLGMWRAVRDTDTGAGETGPAVTARGR
ncbi:methyltransferase family protein [Streptomyces beigongshangae]|uniref:methyltransferase family protein n=1 Tax=Streptomyces beigongshangae TaxID=2841597 RepID=UPI001C84E457|nr:isoprenylcysteine carboxylmethyltransferase family protein [Streptomyces sp. REN17]